MNKLLTKIVGVALGATMAVGVGVAAVKASDGGMQRAEAVEVTVTKTAQELATANSWHACSGSGDMSQYAFSSVALDSNITISFSGSGATATYWSSGTEIRVYGTKNAEGGSVTVSGASGVTIKTFTMTFTLKNSPTVNPAITSNSPFSVNANSQTFTLTSGSSAGQFKITQFSVVYDNGGSQADPTLSVDPESAVIAKNGYVDLTADAENGEGNVSWTTSDSAVASLGTPDNVNKKIRVTGNKQGKAVITASYSTATPINVPVRVADPQHLGTESDPYTPEDAIDSIELNTGLTGVYASGIVSGIVSGYSQQYGNISFNISSDGTTNGDQLQGFRTVGTETYPIDSTNSIKVGDIVTLYGNLVKYGTTYEFAEGNTLVYWERPIPPSITIDQGAQYLEIGDSVTLTATTVSAGGASVVWSSSDTSVATITSGGVVSALAAGTTTITATITVKGTDYTDSINVEVSAPQTPVISVGDRVLVYYGSYFLTGFESTYGKRGDEADALVFDVRAGTNNKTFAFENDGSYLSWTSGNTLTTSDEINANSSWTAFGESMSDVTIANVSDPTRILQYNSSSPRFACYAGTQANASLKAAPASPKELSSLRVEGTPTKTTYTAGESFDSTGLTIYAVFTDSTTYPDEDVTSNVTWGELIAGQTSVTGTYTTGGVSKTCTITGLTINSYSAPVYTLVTNASSLESGDSVVIVSTDNNVAMSTTQNGNNRGNAEVTIVDDEVTLTANVQIFTLETGTVANTFAFNTGDGYIYAASSSKNYLRTETDLDDNGSFAVTIENGNASIVAQGGNTRNTIRYNTSDHVFSCYASGQADVQIYKETSTPTPSGASAYADLFLETLSTGTDAVCDDQGNTVLADLVEAWGTLAELYDDLSPEDKATLSGGQASESGDNIARALALYDYIGKKYNTRLQTETLTDYNFMSRSSANASNSINPINKVNNTVAIVVVVTISLVSVSALGAYFLLRKKKEER